MQRRALVAISAGMVLGVVALANGGRPARLQLASCTDGAPLIVSAPDSDVRVCAEGVLVGCGKGPRGARICSDRPPRMDPRRTLVLPDGAPRKLAFELDGEASDLLAEVLAEGGRSQTGRLLSVRRRDGGRWEAQLPRLTAARYRLNVSARVDVQEGSAVAFRVPVVVGP